MTPKTSLKSAKKGRLAEPALERCRKPIPPTGAANRRPERIMRGVMAWIERALKHAPVLSFLVLMVVSSSVVKADDVASLLKKKTTALKRASHRYGPTAPSLPS
jgi:hypothetical protein